MTVYLFAASFILLSLARSIFQPFAEAAAPHGRSSSLTVAEFAVEILTEAQPVLTSAVMTSLSVIASLAVVRVIRILL